MYTGCSKIYLKLNKLKFYYNLSTYFINKNIILIEVFLTCVSYLLLDTLYINNFLAYAECTKLFVPFRTIRMTKNAYFSKKRRIFLKTKKNKKPIKLFFLISIQISRTW